MASGNTIYHVQFKDCGDNHYFGSLSAIYDVFTPEQVGVALTTLWGFKIDPAKPYENKRCIIRKGVLHRKKGKRTR